MRLQKLRKISRQQSLLLLILADLLLLNSCGSTAITLAESAPDAEWCALVIDSNGNFILADCDWFLEHNPETLSASEWAAKQKSWGVTQCTPSMNMTAIKVFIEDTCSQVNCPEELKKTFLEHFDRISKLGSH